MNPYQEVIDWLRSEEGCKWSEMRLVKACWTAANVSTAMGWNLNHQPSGALCSPVYLGGVLSIKEDSVRPWDDA